MASLMPRWDPLRYLQAVFGSAVLAFGLCHVHAFSGVTEGGVLGLTLLFYRWWGWSPALTGLVLNAACYGLGWRTLGRDLIGYSILSGGGFSLFYALFSLGDPVFPMLAAHPWLAAVAGACFVGVGVGLCVRAGGAPTGDDALAMSVSHLTGWDIRWAYLISDLAVLALSATYLSGKQLAASLLTVVLSGQIIGWIQKIPRVSEKESQE